MSPGRLPRPFTLAEIERIAAIPDPLSRNVEITNAYRSVGLEFMRRTGPWINWCLVAAWASAQAGQSIRGEDLRTALRRHLGVPLSWRSPIDSLWRAALRRGLLNPHTRLGRLVRAIPGPLDAIERTSAAVGEGNLKVFVEIAPVFVRYMAAADFAAFAAGLRDGPPPDGQTLLEEAFTHYAAGERATDPHRKAQLNLHGNVKVAWHEQARLQDQIAASMDAPALTLREHGRRVVCILLPFAANLAPVVLAAGLLAAPFANAARALARRLITAHMMTLALPGGVLVPLGRRLERPYPPELNEITDAELRATLARWQAEALVRGADDWTNLDERMRFIARLQRIIYSDLSLADTAPAAEPLGSPR